MNDEVSVVVDSANESLVAPSSTKPVELAISAEKPGLSLQVEEVI